MSLTSLFLHARDIVLLPGTASILIPVLIYNPSPQVLPGFLSIKVFAAVLFMFGLGLFTWTVYLFQIIAKGTLAPWSEKQKLVISGPYKYCRNPMITGVLTILIAEGIWMRSEPILLWALLFFIINTLYFIIKEEPFLEQKFGDDYRSYKNKVPRWIPSWPE